MTRGIKVILRNTTSAVVMLAACAFAPDVKANPLASELQYLMENYPAIRSKSSLNDAAREDIKAAYGLRLPSISVTGDTGVQRTDLPENTDFRAQAGLTATYNLYDGNFTVFEIQGAKINQKSTAADLDSTRQLIMFQGIQAYLNLVLQSKLVEISKTNVQLVEQIKSFIERESEFGRMSQADLLQARARLAQAKEAMTAYRGSLRQGQNRYFKLFQRVPTLDRMQDPVAPTEVVPETIEEAMTMARKHNPTLQSAELLAEAASNRIGSVESALKPRIDLEGSGDGKYNVDGVDGDEIEGSILLKLNWNLWDGNRTKSQTRAAALRHSAAMMDLRFRHLEIEEQVRNAFSVIETERRRFRTLQEAESIASDAFDARHDMMQAGKETIINVLDTALELLNVRIAVTSADYGHRLANYQLLLATGQLTQDSMSRLIMEGSMQPAFRDDKQLIQKLLDGKATSEGTPAPQIPQGRGPRSLSPTDPASTAQLQALAADDPLLAPEPPLDQGDAFDATTPQASPDGYNDLAAFQASFESTFGAPFSPELLPEGGVVDEGYYLVLGSFSEPAYAQDRISLAGMDNAFTTTVDVSGTTYQRVMVGPMSKAAVEDTQVQVRDRGITDSWVLKQ